MAISASCMPRHGLRMRMPHPCRLRCQNEQRPSGRGSAGLSSPASCPRRVSEKSSPRCSVYPARTTSRFSISWVVKSRGRLSCSPLDGIRSLRPPSIPQGGSMMRRSSSCSMIFRFDLSSLVKKVSGSRWLVHNRRCQWFSWTTRLHYRRRGNPPRISSSPRSGGSKARPKMRRS